MIKKFGFTNKAVVLLLAVGLPLSVLAGCQSKNSAVNSAPNQAASSNNNGFNGQNGAAPNSDQLKQRMENNIKSLVDDKTITQDQADKIVAALTENMQNFGGQNGQRGNQNNNQNRQQNNNQSQNNAQNGQNGQNNPQNNNQGNGQNRPSGRNGFESTALNKLVTDGVITQTQADAVMQKIRGNFNRPQNNQNQQNQQNNQNNQTGQSKQGA